jgi:acyl dehydratase
MGFPVIHADTLVYYKCQFSKIELRLVKNELRFVEFDISSITILDSLVKNIFSEYTNHYWTNTFLDQGSAILGYIEWAKNYFYHSNHSGFNKKGWIVYKGDIPIGFATVKVDGKIGEGILYGVLNEFSGGGIYTDIIRFTQNYLKDVGCEEMLVSTQIQNFAVQKVWSREGFYLFQSFDTYHVNAMLKFKNDSSSIETLIVTEDNLSLFIEATGDDNLVHTDYEFALEKGLKGKIAHGVLIDAIQSKRFGTVNPGHGTLYAGINNVFIEPIYLNEEYFIQFKHISQRSNIYQIITIIKNKIEKIVFVSYNVLIKK